MSYLSERHKAELEQHRCVKAYYDAMRRPWLERVTFAFAFLASLGIAFRTLGIGIMQGELVGEWLGIFYVAALFAFVGLDTIFAKAHYPIPTPLGGFNPSRMYEKFAMQGRSWQLALVLLLPVAARFISAVIMAFGPTQCNFR